MEQFEARIPNIDGQMQILWWEMDELIVMLVCTCLGIAFGMMVPGAIVGFIVSKAIARMKMEKADGYYLHLLWWHGLFPLIKLRVPHWIREFYEV